MSIYEQIKNLETKDIQNYDFVLYHDTTQALMHFLYMAEWFFTRENKTRGEIEGMLDVAFIKAMTEAWHTHYRSLIDAVNHNSISFEFKKMDEIDQAIFLAGGIEAIVHRTPLNILVNEMIEIAKRYGDEGSPKLVNGIGHKIIDRLYSLSM